MADDTTPARFIATCDCGHEYPATTFNEAREIRDRGWCPACEDSGERLWFFFMRTGRCGSAIRYTNPADVPPKEPNGRTF